MSTEAEPDESVERFYILDADRQLMLTAEPSSDVAPYHNRQIVVLGPEDWGRWLDPRWQPAPC